MAVMSEADRVETWKTWMTENLIATAFDKTALRAAVDAADVWVQDNKVSFNSVLPNGAGSFKNEATTKQKASLLAGVIVKRFISGVDN